MVTNPLAQSIKNHLKQTKNPRNVFHIKVIRVILVLTKDSHILGRTSVSLGVPNLAIEGGAPEDKAGACEE